MVADEDLGKAFVLSEDLSVFVGDARLAVVFCLQLS